LSAKLNENYDQAEAYYKKALELEPDNANINNNYALFLKDIHKNDDQAEKHYKKALELKPDNAEINSNYAQFLFIKGEESQAQVYLDKAFNFADNHQDLLAELWFYRLAHYPDYRQQAIKQLDVLLKKGQLHYQVQFLRIFYNTLLLDRNFCEYPLKRLHNCY
jgi:Flp pilus assembly protein TadD